MSQSTPGPSNAKTHTRTLCQSAVIAALFCLAICGALLYWHMRAQAEDPLRSPQLLALKEKLLVTPKDEALKAQIRSLDLELRRRYFYQVWLNRAGGWLAVGAVVAFL